MGRTMQRRNKTAVRSVPDASLLATGDRLANPHPVGPEPLAYLKIINRHELDLQCNYGSLLIQYHPVEKNLKVLLLAK